MAQIFPRSANWASKASIALVLAFAGAALGLLLNINRTHFVTQVNVSLDQPVPFGHKHHVTGMGLDCRYCHTSVEDAAFAGIPPTETCIKEVNSRRWLRQCPQNGFQSPEAQDSAAGLWPSEPDRMGGECRRPRTAQPFSVMSDEGAVGATVHTQNHFRFFR